MLFNFFALPGMKATRDHRRIEAWHQQKLRWISQTAVLLFVFLTGIFFGTRIGQRQIYPDSRLNRPHGSVIYLKDIPYRSTSHIDQKGRPIRKKQLIEPFQIPNLSGFQVAILEPGQKIDLHEHKTMHEIFYIVGGKGVFQINGKHHEVSKGTMIHLAPQEIHSITVDENSSDGNLVMAYFGVAV